MNIHNTNINNFHLSDYKYLFFDIFYKDNKIYLILPIYDNPIDPQAINITINENKLEIKKKIEKNPYEPTLIYIYDYI